MGRMALLIVLGLSMTVGFVGHMLNSSKVALAENVSGFYKYTNARNIAHTGVNMMLRTIDRNDTSIMNPLPRGRVSWLVVNTMAGKCSVSIKLPNVSQLDTIALTSKSSFLDTVFTMKATLVRTPTPFPTTGADGAVAVRVSPAKFTNDGQPIIDGRNYTADGLTRTGSGDKPGILAMTHADSNTLAATWGYPQLDGSPRNPVVNSNIADPALYAPTYISARDYHYPSGTYSGVTWGSSASPVIVDCVTADTLETVKFTGNVEGWGILLVRGNLTIDQNFKFHGLVLVYGDNLKITVKSAGNAQIIGSMIMSGAANSVFNATGASYFKYSSDALNKAKYIGKLLYYKVVSWYE